MPFKELSISSVGNIGYVTANFENVSFDKLDIDIEHKGMIYFSNFEVTDIQEEHSVSV